MIHEPVLWHYWNLYTNWRCCCAWAEDLSIVHRATRYLVQEIGLLVLMRIFAPYCTLCFQLLGGFIIHSRILAIISWPLVWGASMTLATNSTFPLWLYDPIVCFRDSTFSSTWARCVHQQFNPRKMGRIHQWCPSTLWYKMILYYNIF